MSGEKQISLGRSKELYESERDDDTPTQDCVTEQSKRTNEGALYVGLIDLIGVRFRTQLNGRSCSIPKVSYHQGHEEARD